MTALSMQKDNKISKCAFEKRSVLYNALIQTTKATYQLKAAKRSGKKYDICLGNSMRARQNILKLNANLRHSAV